MENGIIKQIMFIFNARQRVAGKMANKADKTAYQEI